MRLVMFVPALRRILAPVALLALTLAGLPLTAAQAQQPTPAELREMGRRLWKEQIRRDGRVTDPARNAMVEGMMNRLQRATGQAGLTLTWAIVNNDTVNAWAAPGGYIAIFRGLMDFADSVARTEFPRDAEAARRRSASFLAGVVAHEISHVTLNHAGDRRAGECLDRVEQEGGLTRANGGVTGEAEIRFVRASVQCMQWNQEQELAADRMGAVYLLRENWRGAEDFTIQGMIDFFAKMDEMSRQRNYFFSPFMTSYLSSHPRGPTRVAHLEMYRAQLKLNQTRLDDALALIASNIELDLASELLDSVQAHFPDLVAARLARAAIAQRKYLNTVPVQSQQVRASVPTTGAAFMENIRGEDMGDASLRSAAQRLFEELLQVDESPATLSNLAVINAYGRDFVQAEARARRAVAEDSLNPDLLNNLGVVLFLAGRYPQARDAFKASLAVSGDSGMAWVVLPPFFNYGRTQLALNDPEGRQVLTRYLEFDQGSEWSKEARRVLGTGAPAREEQRPTRSPSSSKAKLQFAFGATMQEITAAWGRPEGVEQLEGAALLRYSNGRQLVMDDEKGLAAYIYSSREAGDIDGVRVGDGIDRFPTRPVERQDDVLFFRSDNLVIAARVANGIIQQLAIGEAR
jgi:predicted Zn-dependent protease